MKNSSFSFQLFVAVVLFVVIGTMTVAVDAQVGCRDEGRSCGTTASCCSGYDCTDQGLLTKTCTAPQTSCRRLLQTCESNFDCCGYLLCANVSGRSYRRCQITRVQIYNEYKQKMAIKIQQPLITTKA